MQHYSKDENAPLLIIKALTSVSGSVLAAHAIPAAPISMGGATCAIRRLRCEAGSTARKRFNSFLTNNYSYTV